MNEIDRTLAKKRDRVPTGSLKFATKKSNDTLSTGADWRKHAVGYGYALSKRTQLYAVAARVRNTSTSVRSIGSQGLAISAASQGAKASGIEAGIRHFF